MHCLPCPGEVRPQSHHPPTQSLVAVGKAEFGPKRLTEGEGDLVPMHYTHPFAPHVVCCTLVEMICVDLGEKIMVEIGLGYDAVVIKIHRIIFSSIYLSLCFSFALPSDASVEKENLYNSITKSNKLFHNKKQITFYFLPCYLNLHDIFRNHEQDR